jgi:hypothetical protein
MAEYSAGGGSVTITGATSVTQGSAWSTGITGTVAVTQSGSWTLAATQSGAWTVTATQGGSWSVAQSGSWTVAATQSGTWNIGNISGTISLPTGAATSAKQPALGTAGAPASDVLTVQGDPAMAPILVDGSGVTQPVREVPSSAASGATTSQVKSAATTNATSLKASAGNVYGLHLCNNTASAKWFKLFNKASAPTVGTDTPAFKIMIPANATISIPLSPPVRLSTGIAYAITGAVDDADTTATAVDDVNGLISWI